MSRSRSRWLALAAVLLLAACGAPPPSAAPPPPDISSRPAAAVDGPPPIDWVCLLPEADGRVGQVEVQGRSAGAPGVLKGAYNTARVAPDGRLRFVQADAATMAERYGPLLETLAAARRAPN